MYTSNLVCRLICLPKRELLHRKPKRNENLSQKLTKMEA
jgi:hypothetical protein